MQDKVEALAEHLKWLTPIADPTDAQNLATAYSILDFLSTYDQQALHGDFASLEDKETLSRLVTENPEAISRARRAQVLLNLGRYSSREAQEKIIELSELITRHETGA